MSKVFGGNDFDAILNWFDKLKETYEVNCGYVFQAGDWDVERVFKVNHDGLANPLVIVSVNDANRIEVLEEFRDFTYGQAAHDDCWLIKLHTDMDSTKNKDLMIQIFSDEVYCNDD